MKKVDVVAAALVIIGALNWGLAGVFHLNLVATLGLSGLYQALTWNFIQRRWYPCRGRGAELIRGGAHCRRNARAGRPPHPSCASGGPELRQLSMGNSVTS